MSHGNRDLPGIPDDGSGLDDRAMAERLVAALAGMDAPVDGAALLAGARRRAVRIRRRRQTTRVAVAAVLLVGLPLGVMVGGRGRPDSGAESVAGHGPGTTPTSAKIETFATRNGDVTPSVSGPQSGVKISTTEPLPRGVDGAVVVPATAVLPLSALRTVPNPVQAVERSGRALSTTVTPVCTGQPSGTAAGGRLVQFVGTGRGTGWSVASSVRVFAGNGAQTQLDWLRRYVGFCPGSTALRRMVVSDLPGDQVLLAVELVPASGAATGSARGLPAGSAHVIAAVRKGKVTAGLEVVVPPSAAATPDVREASAVELTRSLLTASYQRLITSQLYAAAEADPSL